MNVFSKLRAFPNEEVRIRYYFDDEPKPRIDMTFAEFFGKGGKYTAPFTPPLAYFDEKGTIVEQGPARTPSCIIRCRSKAAEDHRLRPGRHEDYDATWFQYTYLKYPPGTPVETWKGMEVDSPAGADAIRTHGAKTPRGPSTARRTRTHFRLAPRRNEDRAGPFRPRRDHVAALSMTPWSPDTFFHTRASASPGTIRRPRPSICPLGSFFGAGGDTIGARDISGKTLTTLLFGFDAKTGRCYSYWPMPYWSRAQIEIVNDGKTADIAIGDRGRLRAAAAV